MMTFDPTYQINKFYQQQRFLLLSLLFIDFLAICNAIRFTTTINLCVCEKFVSGCLLYFLLLLCIIFSVCCYITSFGLQANFLSAAVSCINSLFHSTILLHIPVHAAQLHDCCVTVLVSEFYELATSGFCS